MTKANRRVMTELFLRHHKGLPASMIEARIAALESAKDDAEIWRDTMGSWAVSLLKRDDRFAVALQRVGASSEDHRGERARAWADDLQRTIDWLTPTTIRGER